MAFPLRALLAVLCAIGIAGCNSDSTGPWGDSGPAVKKIQIAVVPMATTDVFWTAVHAGALDAAAEVGNVKIYFTGPLTMNNREGQINIVQDHVNQQVDGIILAPIDRTALVPYVKDAHDAGVPTVIIDSALDNEEHIVSFVATDNYNGGVVGARALAERMGGKGGAILLRYTAGQESAAQREQGFLDTMKKEFPNITMLSDNQYSGPSETDAYNKAMDLLNQFNNQVDGIFVICNPTATGVLQALEEEGIAGKVQFIGFDQTSHLVQALADEKLHGLVMQDPYNMGFQGVKTMIAHLNGEKVEKRINTGETLATKQNMNDPKVHRLLHPKQVE